MEKIKPADYWSGPVEPMSEYSLWTADFLKENSVRSKKIGEFQDMFHEKADLMEHQLKDGRRVSDFVQCEKDFSHGIRIVLLGLKDEKGQPIPESLWPEEFIRRVEAETIKILAA